MVSVIEDRFTKIENALIAFETLQSSSKNKNALDNVLSSERDLVIDILKKEVLRFRNRTTAKECIHRLSA